MPVTSIFTEQSPSFSQFLSLFPSFAPNVSSDPSKPALSWKRQLYGLLSLGRIYCLIISIAAQMAATHSLKAEKLFSVQDYVCVVTGGGTGIGLMATQALAANGE